MKNVDSLEDMSLDQIKDFIMLNKKEFKKKYNQPKPKILNCPVDKSCNKKFVNVNGVKTHTKQVHNISLSCEENRNMSKKWKKQRQKAIERDNYKCRICGTKISKESAEVHHIIPKRTFKKENGDFLENLVTLCQKCHRSIEANAPLEYQKKIFRQDPELFL